MNRPSLYETHVTMPEDSVIEEALRAYDERRYLEAFTLAHRVGTTDDPRLLLLIARLAAIGGDMLGAVATYRMLLSRIDHAEARAELTDLLARRPHPARAAENYAASVAQHPDIADDSSAPGAQAPTADTPDLRQRLEQILCDDPVHAGALAALANLDVREDRYAEAAHSYRRSLALDPQNAVRRLRLAEVLFDLGDIEASYDEFATVFASQSYFTSKVANESTRVLLLFAPLPWRMNTRFDFLLSTTSCDVLYLTSDNVLDAIDTTRYARIVSCIGAHDAASEPREMLARWIRRGGMRVSNPPEAIEALSRTSLGPALQGLPGFSTAPTTRVARNALANVALPAIIRPPDSQAGRGLARLTMSDDLIGYLRDHDDPEFDVSAYIEYRSDDGYYRKYRIVIIDGIAYPYHLAISQSWMVHYLSADMKSDAWRREEEAAFLADPSSHIPDFASRFSSLATHLGLEYCALDCTIVGKDVFVFEIDPTMLIHVREDDPIFAYRVPFVADIARKAHIWLCREGRRRL